MPIVIVELDFSLINFYNVTTKDGHIHQFKLADRLQRLLSRECPVVRPEIMKRDSTRQRLYYPFIRNHFPVLFRSSVRRRSSFQGIKRGPKHDGVRFMILRNDRDSIRIGGHRSIYITALHLARSVRWPRCISCNARVRAKCWHRYCASRMCSLHVHCRQKKSFPTLAPFTCTQVAIDFTPSRSAYLGRQLPGEPV